MANTYHSGNTVRLTSEFFDWEGNPVEVTFVKLVIYDHTYKVLETFQLGESHRKGVGKYTFEYVTERETETKKYIYEFQGELDGLPSLNRGSFVTKFA